MGLHLRPRMLLLTPEPTSIIVEEVTRRLKAREGRIEGRITRHQFMAWITGSDRALWSPCLQLNCVPHPRGTLIVGRLGPHMFLYSGMMFVLIGTGVVAAISLCWAYVQWSFGDAPMALWGLAPITLALASFWLLDRWGRHRAHDQLLALAELVEGLGELQSDEAGVLHEVEVLRRKREELQ